MKSLVLLGAGASVEANIPDAVKLTDVLANRLKKPNIDLVSAAIAYVRTSLERQRIRKMISTLQGRNMAIPLNAPGEVDIEQVLQSLDSLMNRDSSELAPFVLDWDDLSTSMHSSIFRDARQQLEHALVKELWLDDVDRVRYLDPLIERASNNNLTVVSLNYDNCLELAAKARGGSVENAIEVFEAGRLDFSFSGIPLIKLHGSVDWRLDSYHVGDQDAPTAQNAIVMAAKEVISSSYVRRAMIFGSVSKLSAERPFFDLFLMFYRELMKSSNLYIVGYSFRDPHVNSLIRRWLAERVDGALYIADPNFGANAIDDLPYRIKELRGRSVSFESFAGEAFAKWFS